MTAEDRIIHETACAHAYVYDTGRAYEVRIHAGTHSTVDSAYRRDPDGRSIAIARADYLARMARRPIMARRDA